MCSLVSTLVLPKQHECMASLTVLLSSPLPVGNDHQAARSVIVSALQNLQEARRSAPAVCRELLHVRVAANQANSLQTRGLNLEPALGRHPEGAGSVQESNLHSSAGES